MRLHFTPTLTEKGEANVPIGADNRRLLPDNFAATESRSGFVEGQEGAKHLHIQNARNSGCIYVPTLKIHSVKTFSGVTME